MIMFRSTHEAKVKELEKRIELMQSYWDYERSCSVQQIEDLKKLVFPAAPKALEPIIMEADSVIEGRAKPHQLSDEEYNKLFNEAREASLLLSGDYSDGFIQ